MTENETVTFDNRFSGGGLTLSVQANAPLADTRLAWFGSARASLIVGGSKHTFNTSQSLDDPANVLGGNFSVVDTSENKSTDLLPITELEAGLEYACICGHTLLFWRVAAIEQTYFGVGSSTSENGNLTLFGLQVSGGIGF